MAIKLPTRGFIGGKVNQTNDYWRKPRKFLIISKTTASFGTIRDNNIIISRVSWVKRGIPSKIPITRKRRILNLQLKEKLDDNEADFQKIE